MFHANGVIVSRPPIPADGAVGAGDRRFSEVRQRVAIRRDVRYQLRDVLDGVVVEDAREKCLDGLTALRGATLSFVSFSTMCLSM